MARTYKVKTLEKTRLLKDYASWIYCENCNQTIGYLCYVTYDKIDFKYTCNCGNSGSLLIDFSENDTIKSTNQPLSLIKTRLCCPIDDSPIITIQENKLSSYHYEIVCHSCSRSYIDKNKIRS